MLKAYIIRAMGYKAVYYPSSDRTLSLSDCLKKVFTNENDPLRLNMEVMGEFRNTSTHFVTDEYELFYGPILQECVKFYEERLRELHDGNDAASAHRAAHGFGRLLAGRALPSVRMLALWNLRSTYCLMR